jgi:DNA-binding NtrC family response regulator
LNDNYIAFGLNQHLHGTNVSDSASRRIVYVVDDDRDVRLSLTFQLRTLGFEPHPFVAATDFLDQLETLPPGCVLLDVRMAGMDGFSCSPPTPQYRSRSKS